MSPPPVSGISGCHGARRDGDEKAVVLYDPSSWGVVLRWGVAQWRYSCEELLRICRQKRVRPGEALLGVQKNFGERVVAGVRKAATLASGDDWCHIRDRARELCSCGLLDMRSENGKFSRAAGLSALYVSEMGFRVFSARKTGGFVLAFHLPNCRVWKDLVHNNNHVVHICFSGCKLYDPEIGAIGASSNARKQLELIILDIAKCVGPDVTGDRHVCIDPVLGGSAAVLSSRHAATGRKDENRQCERFASSFGLGFYRNNGPMCPAFCVVTNSSNDSVTALLRGSECGSNSNSIAVSPALCKKAEQLQNMLIVKNHQMQFTTRWCALQVLCCFEDAVPNQEGSAPRGTEAVVVTMTTDALSGCEHVAQSLRDDWCAWTMSALVPLHLRQDLQGMRDASPDSFVVISPPPLVFPYDLIKATARNTPDAIEILVGLLTTAWTKEYMRLGRELPGIRPHLAAMAPEYKKSISTAVDALAAGNGGKINATVERLAKVSSTRLENAAEKYDFAPVVDTDFDGSVKSPQALWELRHSKRSQENGWWRVPCSVTLNSDQLTVVQRVVDMVRGSDATQSLCVLGAGGVGKTETLIATANAVSSMMDEKDLCVTASVNLLLDRIGAEGTIHSVSGLRVSWSRKSAEVIVESMASSTKSRLRKLQVLMVDEVGRLSWQFVVKLDRVLRLVRHRANDPWGGVKIVWFGEFLQTVPIVNNNRGSSRDVELRRVRAECCGCTCGKPPGECDCTLTDDFLFAFETDAWKRSVSYITLTLQCRFPSEAQKSESERIEFLYANGGDCSTVTLEDISLFFRLSDGWVRVPDCVIKAMKQTENNVLPATAVRLRLTNDKVSEDNAAGQRDKVVVECQADVVRPQDSRLDGEFTSFLNEIGNGCMERLRVAIGDPVITCYRVNENVPSGTRGVITRLEWSTDSSAVSAIVCEFVMSGRRDPISLVVKRQTWYLDDDVGAAAGTFTQFPLIVSYSFTPDRFIGSEAEYLHIDFGDWRAVSPRLGTFSLLHLSLSRGTHLDRMKISLPQWVYSHLSVKKRVVGVQHPAFRAHPLALLNWETCNKSDDAKSAHFVVNVDTEKNRRKRLRK